LIFGNGQSDDQLLAAFLSSLPSLFEDSWPILGFLPLSVFFLLFVTDDQMSATSLSLLAFFFGRQLANDRLSASLSFFFCFWQQTID